jgi:hypothetical protein
MSSAQSSSAFAADAPRYGSEPVAAYYTLNDGNAATTVSAITVGGSNLTGDVTIQGSTGIGVDATGNVITITAVGGSNAVTSVTGSNGVVAAPTTGAVVVGLTTTAVTAGSYTQANITVDAYGRLTAAASYQSSPSVQYLLPAAGGGTGNVGSGSTVVAPRNNYSLPSNIPANDVTVVLPEYAQSNVNFFGYGSTLTGAPAPITLTSNVLYRITLGSATLSLTSGSGAIDFVLQLVLWTGQPGTFAYPPTIGGVQTWPVGSYYYAYDNNATAAASYVNNLSISQVVVGRGYPISLLAVLVSPTTGLPALTQLTLVANSPTTFTIENLGPAS